MNRIIIIIVLLFISVTSAHSQSLNDIFIDKSTGRSESVFSFRLKPVYSSVQNFRSTSYYDQGFSSIVNFNGYNFQIIKSTTIFSLNTKFTYFYLSPTYSALGITTELQYNASDLTSLLFTVNPLIRNNTKSSSYGKFLINISVGSKFYFTNKIAKPYFSINAGLFKEPNIKAYFTISPAFGIDYFVNKLIDLNLEAKSNLHNSGLSIGIPMLTFSFSGGVNFKL